jgi:stress response protein SCP2
MVNLTKGQKISLSKEAPELNQMVVGLGWDVNDHHGLFGGLFSNKSSYDYDLDASIICLRGGRFMTRQDICYFGNKSTLHGAVEHQGDNLTGAGEGDDEQIIVKLSDIPNDVDKLVVCVNIYQAKKRRQDFGQVENAFVRICDKKTNTEIMRYSLTDDYAGCIGMIFGEIYRHNGEWKFNPIGEGVKEETVIGIAERYA